MTRNRNGQPLDKQRPAGGNEAFRTGFNNAGNILPDRTTFKSESLPVARLMRDYGLSRSAALVVAELAQIGPPGGAA